MNWKFKILLLNQNFKNIKHNIILFFLQAIEEHNITTKELSIVLKLYKMLKEKNEKIDAALLNELEKKMFFETEKEETVSV